VATYDATHDIYNFALRFRIRFDLEKQRLQSRLARAVQAHLRFRPKIEFQLSYQSPCGGVLYKWFGF